MTGTDKEAAEQETVAQKPTIADRTSAPTETTASDNWKTDNERFRRLAHTGEFAPPAEESPQPKENTADRSTRNEE